MSAARDEIAGRLRQQAGWCVRLGSPLYERLLLAAAQDVDAEGPVWTLLAPHAADPPGSALALRFMGAVHRLVLDGTAGRLARHYPTAGGDASLAGAEGTFLATVAEHFDVLRDGVRRGVQTNEVGRAAALLGGFLLVARETGLPLRLLEIGTSGGLNLRWDHFHYRADSVRWGDPSSPVVLDGAFAADGVPPLDGRVHVAERAGCDANPVDVSSPAGERALIAYCWPDQAERIALLRAAIAVASRVPATIERADAVEWLAARLAAPARGVATVVFHSIVFQYLGSDRRHRLTEMLADAGARADANAPLAWLRMEPGVGQSAAWLRFEPTSVGTDVTLTSWPRGEERLVAIAPPHGRPARWVL